MKFRNLKVSSQAQAVGAKRVFLQPQLLRNIDSIIQLL